MSFRAKSLDSTEHASQNEIARRVEAEIIDRLRLHEQLEAIGDGMIADVLPYTNGDEKAARKLARMWAIESLCLYVYHRTGGDVVFLP